MIEACDKHGVKLFVVKQNRFNLPVVQLRKALEAGRFGNLIMGTVRVRWCRPQSYYDQDSWRGHGLRWRRSYKSGKSSYWSIGMDNKNVEMFCKSKYRDFEAEDTAIVILKFKMVLGVIEATTAISQKT